MGEMIELTAVDSHRLDAYQATPQGKAKGGLVIIQEIFGLTDQMKRVADRYAQAGYLSIVPAMFDRIEHNIIIPYEEFMKGREIARNRLDAENIMADVEAARLAAGKAGNTAILGFCWGGSIAYLAAASLEFTAAISYYGGDVPNYVERMKPRIPVIYHFGERDDHIPLDAVDKVKKANPDNPLYIYQGADHGFCCDDRGSYDADAAALSEDRSLAFLTTHL